MGDVQYQLYGTIDFLPFAEVNSREHIERLWDSHLHLPEHVLMAVLYRLIQNLEGAVKDKNRHGFT